MHICPIVCTVFAIIIFLLVIGTIVFASLAVTKGTSMLTGAIVTASLALVAMLSLFIYYTITTYNDGNWLHYLVDKGTAVQQKAKQQWARATAELERAKADLGQLRQNLTMSKTAKASANLNAAIADAQQFVNEKQLQVQVSKAALPAPIATESQYQSIPTNL